MSQGIRVTDRVLRWKGSAPFRNCLSLSLNMYLLLIFGMLIVRIWETILDNEYWGGIASLFVVYYIYCLHPPVEPATILLLEVVR
jgi:hypothetical protein